MNNSNPLLLWIFFVTLSVVLHGCSDNRSDNYYPDLPALQSPITTYYSPGAKSQADAIQGMLREAAEYYEETLDAEADITAAVVDANYWSEITDVPYGLPGVTGSPPLVYFPADNDHELFKLLRSAIQNSELPACLLMPPDSLAQQFVRLIGFHELGHVYASAYGLNRPNKWVYEFQASYLAYAYLRERNPEMASLWQQTSSLLANRIQPAHTTLSDFEEMYVRVGIENYSWYQGVFQQRVHEVYNSRGLDFIRDMNNIRWSQPEELYFLNVLEDLEPGFICWAQTYGLQ